MKALSAVDLTSPKLPPQNVEAEQSVLGAIFWTTRRWPRPWNS